MLLAALSEAENERDLAQLREELTQSGVLSAKQTRNKKLRGKPRRPSVPLPHERRLRRICGQKQPAERSADTQNCVQERYLVPHAEDSWLARYPRDGRQGAD